MTNSLEASSAGQAARPSVIDTILNDQKPMHDMAQS